MSLLNNSREQIHQLIERELHIFQKNKPKHGKFSKAVLLLGFIGIIVEINLCWNYLELYKGALFSVPITATLLLFGNIILALSFQIGKKNKLLKNFSEKIIPPLFEIFLPETTYLAEFEPKEEQLSPYQKIFAPHSIYATHCGQFTFRKQSGVTFFYAEFQKRTKLIFGQKGSQFKKGTPGRGIFVQIPLHKPHVEKEKLRDQEGMFSIMENIQNPMDIFKIFQQRKTKILDPEHQNIINQIQALPLLEGVVPLFDLEGYSLALYFDLPSFLGHRFEMLSRRKIQAEEILQSLLREIEWIIQVEKLAPDPALSPGRAQ